MSRQFFSQLENSPLNTTLPLPTFISELAFNEQGLIPVVTQDHASGKVLMMAWMNETALLTTLSSGLMTYWSRSRNELWVKGATSGNRQQLEEIRVDCDGDCILCKVTPQGPACHTGREHCYYWRVDQQQNQAVLDIDIPERDKAKVTAAS